MITFYEQSDHFYTKLLFQPLDSLFSPAQFVLVMSLFSSQEQKPYLEPVARVELKHCSLARLEAMTE